MGKLKRVSKCLSVIFVPLLASIVDARASENFFCDSGARDYREINSSRDIMNGENMSAAYSLYFIRPKLDREAEAVLKLSIDNGGSIEESLEEHMDRYHSRKSENERKEIHDSVSRQFYLMEEIEEMIKLYEEPLGFSEINEGLEVFLNSWFALRERTPDTPDYQSDLRRIYEEYIELDHGEQDAALRAYHETVVSVQLDYNIAGISRFPADSPCYLDALFDLENGLRLQRVNDSAVGKYSSEYLETVSSRPRMKKFAHFTHGLMGAYYGTYRASLIERVK